MSESELADSVSNFWASQIWNDNDTQILGIVMPDGIDRLWKTCGRNFWHPDSERAVKFLIERPKKYEMGEQPLNYIQTLGTPKDVLAVPLIGPYF
jgi:hypothetical protein